MIIVPPALTERPLIHYVAKANAVTLETFGTAIPESLDAVETWLAERGIEPSGGPLIRYRVIDMETVMQVEIGWPVAEPVDADDARDAGLVADSLPAGMYGVTTYRGIENGIAGNGALIQWADDNGIEWDRWDEPTGDAFRARVEFELTDPAEQPDPSTWDTEVAILVKKP
jgi:hypothetical protein